MLQLDLRHVATALALVMFGGVFTPTSAATRVEGPSRSATSVEVSRAWFDSAETVIVARDDSYADALAGAPLAGALGAPILFVEHGRVPGEVRDEIARLGADEVIALGGPAAISDAVVRSLGARRIADDARWGTAAKLARAVVGNRADHVYLVTGTSFPDAVAVAGLAAETETPVLLTEHGDLPAATVTVLRDLRVKRVTVVGGPVAVSDRVLDQVRSLGASVSRLAGGTRYDTSAAVVQASVQAGMRSTHRIVASGEGFSDALAGGPAAAKGNRILALAPRDAVGPAPLAADDGCRIDGIAVIGGRGAVSDEVLRRLAAAEDGDCTGDPKPGAPRRAVNGEAVGHDLLNDRRAAVGRGSLPRANDLDEIAYDWSVEQARQDRMHHNPNLGSQVTGYRSVAENVGVYRTGGTNVTDADVERAIRSLHDTWMGSSGHRRNMEDTRWDDIGFGVHVEGDAVWATMIFRERA